MNDSNTPERFDLDSVAEEFGVDLTEPAPLDPSKVKAGDTVTVTRNKAIVTDEVESVSHGSWSGTHIDLKDGRGTFILGNNSGYAWTLTDHQPAPEPEPRDLLADAIFEAIRDQPDSHSKGAEVAADAVRAKFVVIDPATVDWRGLQSQMSVLVVGAEPFKRAGDILDVVRRELGIEAS